MRSLLLLVAVLFCLSCATAHSTAVPQHAAPDHLELRADRFPSSFPICIELPQPRPYREADRVLRCLSFETWQQLAEFQIAENTTKPAAGNGN